VQPETHADRLTDAFKQRCPTAVNLGGRKLRHHRDRVVRLSARRRGQADQRGRAGRLQQLAAL
jgi:hypothetical protein